MSALRRYWLSALLLILLPVAWTLGCFWQRVSFSDRLLAVAWVDWAPGQPQYGAYVLLEPAPQGYVARLQLYVDRPSPWIRQSTEPIELGTVLTEEEAVRQWGQLAWESGGLRVGTGPVQRLIPAGEILRHR